MSITGTEQPGQIQIAAANADGVLTVTYDIFMNPAVATSLADEASATSTVTADSTGKLHVVTVITPNTPVTTADNTIYSAPINTNAPGA